MIITSCTEDYVPYLKVLLASLEANSPQDQMTVYPVNFESPDLQERFPQYRFEPRHLNLSKNKDGIMCVYRTVLLKEHFDRSSEPILWLDVDTMVRKDLAHFWGDIRPNSLKIFIRDGDDIRKRFQTGVFAFGNSDATKRFVEEYNEACQNDPAWYQDQIMIYLLYEEYRSSIDLISMSADYNDKRHPKLEGSTIWHYKMRKKSHPKYEKRVHTEYMKYLRLAENSIV